MIKYKNVTYKVKDKNILSNINFEIKSYEKVLLVGPSGSGKSTILNLLIKYIKPTSGNIYFNKKDIFLFNKKQTLKYRQNKISMISQKDDLFDYLSVFNNLTLFYYENDIINLLKQFELLHLKDRLVSSLSGGERQRIAIIKSCLASCDILLCDEITSALDKENAIKIIDFILKVFKDKTIIFISHDESLFENKIDHIIRINDGKISENILINNIEYKANISKINNRKKLINVALNQSLKKISISLFLLCLLTIICFFVSFNFNDFFNYFSKLSYQKYFNYDVLYIKNNTSLKENNIDIFLDMSKEVKDCKILINDISILNIEIEPFKNKGNSNVVVNNKLLKHLNIKKINTLKIKGENITYQSNNIDVINEDNIFTTPTIYIDNDYFLTHFSSKYQQYILISNSFNFDDRFTLNPMYTSLKENKPYLDSKAYQDYLTVDLIFTSLKDVVNYYFIAIFFYSTICSVLINVSIIYKDIKQIGIYISRGYEDYQIILFYVFPLIIYYVIFMFLLLISFKMIFCLLFSFIIQLLSILISYYYIKNKSIYLLLKEETYI